MRAFVSLTISTDGPVDGTVTLGADLLKTLQGKIDDGTLSGAFVTTSYFGVVTAAHKTAFERRWQKKVTAG